MRPAMQALLYLLRRSLPQARFDELGADAGYLLQLPRLLRGVRQAAVLLSDGRRSDPAPGFLAAALIVQGTRYPVHDHGQSVPPERSGMFGTESARLSEVSALA